MLDLFFFFFKQKTAYEMRISDWSSDVCSSDLGPENQGSERSIASLEYRQLPAAPMSPRWGISGESRRRQHKRAPIRPFRPTHRWRWRACACCAERGRTASKSRRAAAPARRPRRPHAPIQRKEGGVGKEGDVPVDTGGSRI